MHMHAPEAKDTRPLDKHLYLRQPCMYDAVAQNNNMCGGTMTEHALRFVAEALERVILDQHEATALWHEKDPSDDAFDWRADKKNDNSFYDVLRPLVLRQHLMNFRLWHKEDEARRRDVDNSVIAECKRYIDVHNQRRNDGMERVDECIVRAVIDVVGHTCERHNTESVGMVVDRLSILSLKIFHMEEETQRWDADHTHREACAKKLMVLLEQRTDLRIALLDLIEEFAVGTKSPKVYYQFKMYNDPSLNPQLYKK